MKDGRRYAGIDVGTTGVRCVIFDEAGTSTGRAYAEYPLVHLRDGHVEQSVALIVETTMRVCSEVMAAQGVGDPEIAGIGLSTQMCGLIPCRSDGSLVRPMISWQDARAIEQVERLAVTIDAETYVRITGYPQVAQAPLMKILWLRDHEAEAYRATEYWLQVHHVILHALGSEGFFMDGSEANFTGLWDVSAHDWSQELLEIAGIESDSLGQVVRGGTQVGVVSAAAAALSGFAEGTPLCVGAGDQISGVVGTGVTKPGTASLTLGTAGFLCTSVTEPRVDVPGVTLSNHVVQGEWILSSVMLAAASSLKWFRDVFGSIETAMAGGEAGTAYDLLTELASQAPAGADGVVFLPFLNSAGAPRWNPAARAAFIGIAQHHERSVFARSVLEGVAFEVRDNLEHWAEHGVRPHTLRATGGAMRSALWSQIVADVTGLTVELTDEPEATALGAGMLAAVGVGDHRSVADAAATMVRVSRTVDPNETSRHVYDNGYRAYVDACRGLFERERDSGDPRGR